MINFFRKKRKNLADKNKPIKYLRYAIGEIVLVMIGILLALQVNTWNESEKSKKVEKKYLQQIAAAIRMDVVDFDQNIAIHEQALTSSRIIFNALQNNQEYHDSLAMHFSGAFLNSVFSPNIGAYESLKSVGIETITNNDLQIDILNLYEETYLVLRTLESHVNAYAKMMLLDRGRAYFQKFVVWERVEEGSRRMFRGTIGMGESPPLNFEKLKNDKAFMYDLQTFQGRTKSYVGFTENTKQLVLELYQRLQSEINK